MILSVSLPFPYAYIIFPPAPPEPRGRKEQEKKYLFLLFLVFLFLFFFFFFLYAFACICISLVRIWMHLHHFRCICMHLHRFALRSSPLYAAEAIIPADLFHLYSPYSAKFRQVPPRFTAFLTFVAGQISPSGIKYLKKTKISYIIAKVSDWETSNPLYFFRRIDSYG